MILRLQTKPDRNGNRRQIEINTSTGETKHGYFIFCDPDAIIISLSDYKKIREQIKR